MGFIKLIITVAFWLQAFAAPVLLMGLIALAVNSSALIIPFLAIGILAGVFVAEYIRRKIGLDIFFGRIYGPNEMDDKQKEK